MLFIFLMTLPALFICLVVAGLCSVIFKKKKLLMWGVYVYASLLAIIAGVGIYEHLESAESKFEKRLAGAIPQGVSSIEFLHQHH